MLDTMKPPELHQRLKTSLNLIRTYDSLIDSYVLDFYTGNHWNSLPTSWKQNFSSKNPEDFAELLSSEKPLSKLWPLSILCTKALIDELSLKRIPREQENTNELLCHPKMKHIFVKNLNPKKRHEVAQMSQVSSESAMETNVKNVVDFGAGLGHLSRVLGYGYDLNMICLEMQDQLNEEAKLNFRPKS
ncbi:RRNAD1.2 family protein [Megaselia abdita]